MTALVPLCVVALFLSNTIGQDVSSSGDDSEIVPDLTFLDYLIKLLCQSRPESCEDFDFCPCGSNIENILHKPNDFYVLQMFPCGDINSSKATFRECDTFIQYGAENATYRSKNEKELDSLDYLYLDCFALLNDIYLTDSASISTLAYGFLYPINNNEEFSHPVIGMLGPSDPKDLEIMSYIAGNFFQKITISYSSSTEIISNPQKYPYFYSTIPPPLLFVKVVLQLLADFNWRRVAVISSNDAAHLERTDLLLHYGNSMNKSNELAYLNYHEDPLPILTQFKNDDYRIFVANIESSKARTLFCKAISLNLTTERHQWILPSFYDQKWWNARSDCSEYEADDCCTDEQVLEAAVGTIFVGESNVIYGNKAKEEAAYKLQHKIYLDTLGKLNLDVVDIVDDDELYILHSRALYAYDAMYLFATVLNDALMELFNSTQTEKEQETMCEEIKLPSRRVSSNVLTEKMVEILERSVYCGFSGYYIFANKSTLGQAWVTQFQYFPNCTGQYNLSNFEDGCYKESDIGHYANFVMPGNCKDNMASLQPANSLNGFDSNATIMFTNSCCSDTNPLIHSCPYIWKGDNPWKAPVDGACHNDSCRCLNQLGTTEIVVAAIITATGITLCCVLLMVNCLLRNNRHIKASSPRFNTVIIVGSMLIYLLAVIRAVSFSGRYISGMDIEFFIPISCEVVKWSEHVGFSLIITTMLSRNWRLYRIFFNPGIQERRFLSDVFLAVMIIVLMVPTVLFLILWTAVDPYKFEERREPYSCPGLDVDDSIATYRVTYLSQTEHTAVWEGIIFGYRSLLGAFLIFFGYQNSQILSTFAQEGEFATRSMFCVFLFLIPMFSISLVGILASGTNLTLIFWATCGYVALFPTVLLTGLYMPKFILIVKDARDEERARHTQKVQASINQVYESKINQIEDLKIRLRERQSTLVKKRALSLQLSGNESIVSYKFHNPRQSLSPSVFRQEFFDM